MNLTIKSFFGFLASLLLFGAGLFKCTVNAYDSVYYISMSSGDKKTLDCSDCDGADFISDNVHILDYDYKSKQLIAYATGSTSLVSNCPLHGRKYYKVHIDNNTLSLGCNTTTLYYGGKVNNTYQLTPTKMDKAPISYSSSDREVASVNANGLITARGEGAAVITLSSGNSKCEFNVNVEKARLTIPVNSITLSTKGKGRSYAVRPLLNIPSQKIIWKTSDSKIAKVSNGTITGLREGHAVITASCGELHENIEVNVSNTLTLSEKYLCLYINDYPKPIKLNAYQNGKKCEALLTSSDNNIVSVDNGMLTPKSVGTATITATKDDMSDVCVIDIKNADISLDRNNLYLDSKGANSTYKLNATYNASANTKLKWSSSNKRVATIDSKGKITCTKPGNATIYATIGTLTATCDLTVADTSINDVPVKIVLDDLGCTYKLSPKVLGTSNAISYLSSNTNIITVSENGVIKACCTGKARVTITASGLSKKIDVTVNEISTTLNKNYLGLSTSIYKSEKLKASVKGKIKKASFSSSDDSIATVTSDGKVTAISPGVATITATANDRSDRCIVYVTNGDNVDKSATITLDKKTITLNEHGDNISDTLYATVNKTDEPVTFCSSNPKVVKVTQDGIVSAQGSGSATITASVLNKRATCKVKVIDNSIKLNKSLVNLDLNNPKQKKFVLKPTVKGIYKNVEYTSTNKKVAIVEGNTVVAVDEGCTTIIASSNGVNAYMYVNVINSLHEHDYKEIHTTNPTCTKAGTKILECAVCADLKSITLEALGHDFSKDYSVDVNPSCTRMGSKSKHCLRKGCNEISESCEIDKLPHSYVNHSVTNNNIENGYKYDECSYCSDITNEKYLVKVTGDNILLTDSAYCSKGESFTVTASTIDGYDFDGFMIGDELVTTSPTYTIENINSAVEIIALTTKRTIDVTADDVEAIYDGSAHYASIVTNPADATITYSLDNSTYSGDPIGITDAGEYTLYYKATRDNYVESTGTVSICIKPCDIKNAALTPLGNIAYKDAPVCPIPILEYNGHTLLNSKDFTCTYSNNSVLGAASVYITGCGNYEGSTTIDYNIDNINTTLLPGPTINKTLKQVVGSGVDDLDRKAKSINMRYIEVLPYGPSVDVNNRTSVVYDSKSCELNIYYNASKIYTERDFSCTFSMFGNVDTITGLDILDTRNTYNMSKLFTKTGYYAESFTLDMSTFILAHVTNLTNAFFETAQYASTWSIIIPYHNCSKADLRFGMTMATFGDCTDHLVSSQCPKGPTPDDFPTWKFFTPAQRDDKIPLID